MRINIRKKIEELAEEGIDVYDIIRRDNIIGGGISFKFFLEDWDAQKDYLPKAGEWASNTSLAIVKPTGQAFVLGRYGWEPFGG